MATVRVLSSSSASASTAASVYNPDLTALRCICVVLLFQVVTFIVVYACYAIRHQWVLQSFPGRKARTSLYPHASPPTPLLRHGGDRRSARGST